MKASVLDLRYRMNEVLKALERRERVTLLYHGKTKGTIVPVGDAKTPRTAEHPFFGMAARAHGPVGAVMDRVRRSRHR